MADTTTRFAITEPSAARTDAADVPFYIRNVVQAVENLGVLFGQGTLANRPAAGVQGRIYAATDQTPPRVYYDSGSAWFDIGVTNDASYRILAQTQSGFDNTSPHGSGWIMGASGKPVQVGNNLTVPGMSGIPIIDIVGSELSISGKTAKLSISAVVAVNNVAPAVSYTFSIVPLASVGGISGQIILNTGAAVVSAVFAAPAASTITKAVSADVNLPADGQYVVQVDAGANPANGTVIAASAKARVRYV